MLSKTKKELKMKLSLTTITALALSAGVAMAGGFSKPKLDTSDWTDEEIQFVEDHNNYTYDIGVAGVAASLGAGWAWVDQNRNGIFAGSIVGVNSRDVTHDVRLSHGDGNKMFMISSRIRFDTEFRVDEVERWGIDEQSLSGIEVGQEFPIQCYETSYGHNCKVFNYHVNVIVRDFPGLAISTSDVVEMLDDILEDELGTAIRIEQDKQPEYIYKDVREAPNGWLMVGLPNGRYNVISPDKSQVYRNYKREDVRNWEVFQ